MTTEIVRRDAGAPTLPEKMDWVRAMASASLLPRQYQNNPGNLLFAVEYADALGVDRMAAITSIHVIDGKPSASADLIANLVRKAGHRLRVSGDDNHAVAQIIRADDPEFTYEARWDIAKARAAGLAGKGVWKNYPGAMLRSRAITEVARMGASDALFGVIYTPEELGAEIDGAGQVVHSVTAVQEQPPATGTAADRMRQIVGTPQPAAAPAQSPDAEPEGITPPQIKKLATAMGQLGLTERTPALAYVADVVGRQVESRNDLTKAEASRVIEALEADIAASSAPAAPPADEEPVDAEIVPDPPGAEPDANSVWDAITVKTDAAGWARADVEEHFASQMGGLSSAEASAAELQKYLDLVTARLAAEQVPA